MCGIVGYIGKNNAATEVVKGLKSVEYRGYDSAGLAYLDAKGSISLIKRKGKVASLEAAVTEQNCASSAAIGHTRWATHGKVCEENSHPFLSYNGAFAVAHNGIIENYCELKAELLAGGAVFASETDSEVITHLIEKEYNEAAQACVAPGAFDCEAFCLNAILKVAARLKGAFAIAVLSKHTPSAVYAARCESPLAVGYNEDGFYLLSDIDALSEFTSLGTPLDNKSAAVISLSDGIKFVRFDGTESAQRFSVLEKSDKKTHGDTEKQFKGDKMLAEIYETPSALEKCALNFPFYDSEFFRRIPLNSFDEIRFIGCGTAYHAALHGAFLTRKLCKKLTVSAHLASEYLYDNYREDTSVLLVLVSQSGETADTLGVLRRAQKNRTYCLAVVNCESSALAREADFCIFTKAGREVAVASTKAYNTQLLILTLLAYNIAGARGQTTVSKLNNAYETAKKIGSYAAAALENECAAKAIAQEIKEKKDVFFIGRGLDSFCALEGALKLKEVSYIHAEGFAAGELKHGSIALIEDGTPVIALLTQPETAQKTQNGIEEVKARGAAIHRLTVANSGKKSKADRCNLVLPHIENADFLPVIATIPLNFVAYYTALYKGCDADKPRNLAKSVTVE